jgi:hypothetical protein
MWKAASLSSGLGVVAFAILSVLLSLNGMEELSNLLVALIIVSMGIFVVLQVGWPPKDQVSSTKE